MNTYIYAGNSALLVVKDNDLPFLRLVASSRIGLSPVLSTLVSSTLVALF